MVFNPLPERFNLPLVGMSEMMGCIFFRLLRDRGMELFADEPEVVERIRVLFNEILADELCHVGLIEARLGAFGRSLMHRLYRVAATRASRLQPPEHELFDQIWLSPAVAGGQTGAFIDRHTKHGGDGSDHDPGWVVLDL